MAPGGFYLRLLRELAIVILISYYIILGRSWQLREVPNEQKKTNITLIITKIKKANPSNNSPVSLTSAEDWERNPPGSPIQDCMTRRWQGKVSIDLPRGNPACLLKYHARLFGKRITVHDIYLDFSKMFDMVSRSILGVHLRRHRLEKWTVRGMKTWVDFQTPKGYHQQYKVQMVVITSSIP